MIPPFVRGRPIVDEQGNPNEIFFQWALLITDLQPATGTGSPEGVVEARANKIYYDTAVDPVIGYFKVYDQIGGNRKNGWKVIA